MRICIRLSQSSLLLQLFQRTPIGNMTFDGYGGHAKYDKFPEPSISISFPHMKRTMKSQRNKSNESEKSET